MLSTCMLALAVFSAQAPAPARCQMILAGAGLHCTMPCCAKRTQAPVQCPMFNAMRRDEAVVLRAPTVRTTLHAIHRVAAILTLGAGVQAAALRAVADRFYVPWFSPPPSGRAPPSFVVLLSA